MRSRLLQLSAIVVLLSVALAARADQASACTCGEPPPPAVGLDQSAAVFSGDLIAIRGYSETSFAAILTFDVSRVWKGDVTETFVMMTSSLGAGDCGFPFEAGRAYLVYAYEREGYDHLTAWLCTRTQPLEYADEDLTFLGEGRLPAPPETGAGSASTVRDEVTSAPAALMITGVVVAVVLALAARASIPAGHRARRS